MENTIANVVLIENNGAKHKTVRLGSTVTILDLDMDEEETFTIVGSVGAKPEKGLLSNVSPLSQAMMDQKPGTTVTVKVEKPYDVKIISIKQ